MADTLVFDDFVRTRSPHLLRVAYLLTRDHNHAEDLLQTALARSWSAWHRIDDNPEPYVRRVLVNTYASWRGRRWHGELPSESLPEPALTAPQSEVDNRDEVWRALGRLPHQQRAVLVLRYFEDMSELQIADALGISTGTVKSHAAKGIANLRGDETLRQIDIQVPDLPEGTERLAGVHARIRSRRVRRVATAAIAGVVAVAVLLALLAIPSFHLRASQVPTTPLPAGAYYQGTRVVAAVVTTSDRTATLTWTPTSTTQFLLMRCVWPDAAGPGSWSETVYSGPDVLLDGPECGRAKDYRMRSIGIEPDQIGRPLTITARVDAYGVQSGPGPRDSVIYLGISTYVPSGQYPWPTRPSTLPKIDHYYQDPATPFINVPTAVSGPGLPTSVRLTPGTYDIHIVSQTPGSIAITVRGQPGVFGDFWDYRATPVDHQNVRIGAIGGTAPVTVMVNTQNLTGDWFVAFCLVS
jgi:RNA polymerase sigma-70 factor (sigma-E family)